MNNDKIIYAGDSLTLNFNISNSDGTPMTLNTLENVILVVAESKKANALPAIVKSYKTNTVGYTEAGKAIAFISSGETKNIPGKYYCEVKVVATDHSVATVDAFTLTILESAIDNRNLVVIDGVPVYVFHQEASSNIWVITHNLNKYPHVVVMIGNEVAEADIQYNSADMLTIRLSETLAGDAYLS